MCTFVSSFLVATQDSALVSLRDLAKFFNNNKPGRHPLGFI